MSEVLRNPEANQEGRFGRNVRVEIEFMRHEVPGKTPTGMSADFLTEQGQENAAAKGQTIDKPVKGYSSPKLRAQETIEMKLQNTPEDVQVINRFLIDPASQGKKTVGQIAIGQKSENAFNIRLRPELDTARNFDKIMPEAKTWAQGQIKNDSPRGEHDFIILYFF